MRLTYEQLIKDALFEDAIRSFLRVEEISDIVLLGTEGGIRRIIFGEEDSLMSDLVRKNKKELRKRLNMVKKRASK